MEFRKHGISQPVGLCPGCPGFGPVHESIRYPSPAHAHEGTVYSALLKIQRQRTEKNSY